MSKDLFDDSTMSFGEHLECLRTHLIKAIYGLVLGVILALFFSNHVIQFMQIPVQNALENYYGEKVEDKTISEFDWWDYINSWVSGEKVEQPADGAKPPKLESPPAEVATSESPIEPPPKTSADDDTPAAAGVILAKIDALELWKSFHEMDPKFPAPPADAKSRFLTVRIPDKTIVQAATSSKRAPTAMTMATTFTPEEAFLVYIKVAVVTGLVISSPWVFYQIWLFVAAGLYPHERKYVHTFLPMSLGLFLGGALFCFFAVIPYVLDFLFGFNAWLGIVPQIRITEWISFAVVLPVMFGISFQLPLVMLFLERISIFDVAAYREQRRMAYLIISIISMLLTPSDPMSMMLMMIPLCILYEVGILLSRKKPESSPFPA